ncbi:MAG: hypothetical protein HY815_09570 [Candidatus Riflebacteria bacterium]|nr:hypothetical protein [Candidatus Riflebacteria bacterium]
MLARVGPARPGGFTVIEVVVCCLILALVLYALFDLLGAGTKMSRQELELLGLQADSQRSVVRFLATIQESMEVMLPQPGSTLPYAMVRDKLNQVVVFSLVESKTKGEYDLKMELLTPQGRSGQSIMSGVSRLTFSTLSDGALRLHMTLMTGNRRYAFYTQIRCRNRDAAGL